MLPSPSRARSNINIDFSTLKQESQRRLFKLLDKYEGSKTIIFDDKLIGPFEFVASATLLKQHDASRLFRLSDVKLPVLNDIKTEHILIFLRKDYNVAKHLADILQRSNRITLSKISLVFVPYRCASVEKLLEQNKFDLSKLGSIEQLKIQLFVLDTDVLSTENEKAYCDLYLRSDHSFAHEIADGLIQLQEIYGQIPKITGQGKGAKIVCDLLLKHKKLHMKPQTITTTTMVDEEKPAQIQQLVLIDRRIDLITPFLTQLTYEGLLDEIFGINHGTITLPGEKFISKKEDKQMQQQQEQQPDGVAKRVVEPKRFELKSSEELFARLRDCHTNAVAEVLKQSAKNLQAEYEECRREGKTIVEIGKIVKRLNHLKVAEKSQSNHVAMAELVNEHSLKADFIYGLRIEHELLQEDHVNRIHPEIDMKLLRQEPPLHVLRLICLQSIISNGLKSKVSDYYKREIIQNYGPKYIAYLLQLERSNLLLTHERFYDSGTFNQLNNRLSLVRDDVDECNPSHYSYVYGGYTPISVTVARILAYGTQSPIWRSQSDNLRLLPEPTISHSDVSQIQMYQQQQQQQQQQLQQQPQQQAQQGTLRSGLQVPFGMISSSMTSEFAQPQPIIGSAGSLTSNAVAAASAIFLASGTSHGTSTGRVRRNSATSSQSSSEDAKTVLVFFIGGCTLAEITALRFISQQEENNIEFLIGTTKIINGKTFLSSIWPHATEIDSTDHPLC